MNGEEFIRKAMSYDGMAQAQLKNGDIELACSSMRTYYEMVKEGYNENRTARLAMVMVMTSVKTAMFLTDNCGDPKVGLEILEYCKFISKSLYEKNLSSYHCVVGRAQYKNVLSQHHKGLGQIDLALEAVNEGITVLSGFLKIEPSNVEANMLLDQMTANREVLKKESCSENYSNKRILLCTQAIELDPCLAEAYCDRGSAYAQQGDFTKAMDDFCKAIELDPNYAGAYNNRGIASAELHGNFNKAIEDFNKAVELDPNFAEAYSSIGHALLNQEDFNKAITYFNKAIELNPNIPEIYGNRGIAYRKLAEQAIDSDKIAEYTRIAQIDEQKYYELNNA